MKKYFMNHFQIDHKFQRIGWIILIPSLLLGLYTLYFEWELEFLDCTMFAIFNDPFMDSSARKFMTLVENNLTNELFTVLIIGGALMVILSKEKEEDEYIRSLRHGALIWAIIANSILILFFNFFTYDLAFLHIMIFNLFTPLLIFILRFRYVLGRSRKAAIA